MSKKFIVTFSMKSTYTTEVLADSEEAAIEIINRGELGDYESDGWEPEIEAFGIEEIAE